MNYTNTQLKQALAKMLPDHVSWQTFNDERRPYGFIYWKSEHPGYRVLDTELLHLCWLVEEILDLEQQQKYADELESILGIGNLHCDWCSGLNFMFAHATWQQRTIALAKVKGVEIV